MVADINKNEPAVETILISIKDVHKSFGDHDVLQGVNLTVNEGENLVVLGKSGSGKSVLIKCMVGLESPDTGEVNVFDKNVVELDDNELNEVRLKIGFLFQSAALYDSMSVGENLDFPLQRAQKKLSFNERQTIIKEALDSVGLGDAIDKMPAELSGGMRKRIGLARSIILKPAIMLYDEPTTGLDSITSREISELILELQKKNNTTSVIITHDMPCAKLTADRIVVLKEGKIVAEGTYDSLEKHEDEWIRSFFN